MSERLVLPAERGWVAAAALLIVAIAVLDHLTPPSQIYLGILVVPPLFAAARAGPRSTFWIAVVSLLVAAALGLDAGIFLTPQHVLRLLVVAGCGVLSVGLARERHGSQRVLAATYRISQAAHTATSPQALFGAIHESVGELMPARNFYIALYDAPSDTISFPYFVDEFDRTPAPKRPGKGLTEYVLRTGQALLLRPDVSVELERRGEVEVIGAPSIDWLGVPLQTDAGTIGVLVVQSYTERVRYTEAQRRVLQFVSTQVAMAIQRKQAEEALRESEERYRSLAAATVEAIALHENERILEVNPAFLRMFGYDDEREVVGRPIYDFGPPGEAREVAAAVRQGRETAYEALGLRRDGTTFVGEVTGRSATYRGRQVRMTAIRDVTARKRAEAERRTSEQRLSQAQAIAHLGVWELDLADLEHVNANALWWSDETYRIFGYPPGAFPVSNEVFFRHVHPDDRRSVEAAVQEAVRERKPYFIEHRIILPDGTHRVVQEHATADYDDAGRPRRLMGTVLDVTEQRRLEDQLRQAQKMEAVGQLAGGIAHDFNNLLTTILTMCQMLRSQLPDAEPVQADLEAIRGAAQHGTDLTRKLLAFARHQRLQLKTVAVAPLIEEFMRMARRVVPEDVELRLELAAPDACVEADPAALEQILMNLVTNARDAMPAGGQLVIGLGTTVLDLPACRELGQGTPGAYVVLSVSDTGLGMDAETQRRMFEPFFTTKPVGQGTGLGMPMIYGLVKDHGGFVHVASQTDRGTTVRVFVPAASAEAAAAAAADPALRGGSETILLVEDDEALRRAGRRVLEKYGYTVIAAGDGVEALEIIRARPTPPDLVVSDVVMPHSSGPQLLRSLRDAGLTTRILFTSGYPARDVHERTPLEPGVPFLTKPWTIPDLVRRVREVLDAPATALPPA